MITFRILRDESSKIGIESYFKFKITDLSLKGPRGLSGKPWTPKALHTFFRRFHHKKSREIIFIWDVRLGLVSTITNSMNETSSQLSQEMQHDGF
jgi:hypothetical protein